MRRLFADRTLWLKPERILDASSAEEVAALQASCGWLCQAQAAHTTSLCQQLNPQLLEEEGLLGFVVLILESEADAHSPDGAGELLAQAVQ